VLRFSNPSSPFHASSSQHLLYPLLIIASLAPLLRRQKLISGMLFLFLSIFLTLSPHKKKKYREGNGSHANDFIFETFV